MTEFSVHHHTIGGSPPDRKVRIPGREDHGVIVDQEQLQWGNNPSVLCYVIYFAKTGEVLTFEASKVSIVDPGAEPQVF